MNSHHHTQQQQQTIVSSSSPSLNNYQYTTSTNTCIPSHYSRPLSPPSSSNTQLPSIHSLKEFAIQQQQPIHNGCPIRTAASASSNHYNNYYPMTHLDQYSNNNNYPAAASSSPYTTYPVHTNQQQQYNTSSGSSHGSAHSDALSSEDSNASPNVNRKPSPIKVKNVNSNTKSDGKIKAKSPNSNVINTSNSGIKKKRKTKKNKIIIATSELVRCMTLPQTVAAKKLKVSLSTLKRRFYELSVGRWPSIAPTNEQGSSSKAEEEIYVEKSDATPEQKLSLSFVLNKKDCPESSVIDNLSMVILKVAFTLNTNEEK